MISVAELDNIARARIEDTKALFTAGRFDGATYLCGYAVEEARIMPNHFPLWNAVARWTVESRYNAVGAVQQPGATAMIQAAEEKGPFALFALFMREGAPDCWDLIVSAPWVGDDTPSVVDYFVSEIKSRLGAQVLTSLSRIVVINPQNAAVEALNRSIQVEHGRVEVRDSDFFGLTVKHACIITSQRPQAPAPRKDAGPEASLGHPSRGKPVRARRGTC